jgi:tyrosyl-tRNA synthetase
LPLLEGTDGVEKMSKTYKNEIGLLDSPEDKYGKIMSISDDMIVKYFRLAADADDQKVEAIKSLLSDSKTNPRDVKRELGRAIVKLYHGADEAQAAEQHFDKVIVQKGIPDEIDEVELKSDQLLVDIITNAGLTKSKGEARRLIKQNAVKLDSAVCKDIDQKLHAGKESVIKVGKRRFLKVK